MVSKKNAALGVVLVLAVLFGQSAAEGFLQAIRLRLPPVEAQLEVVPTGAIFFIKSDSCPANYVEDTDVNGKTIVGTLVANGNVGGTGGNDNITPVGTNSAASFTGTAWSSPAISWPAGVPTQSGTTSTFTGSSSTVVVNHTHTLATGTGSTGNFSQVVGTVDTSSGGNGGAPTQTALGTVSGNPVSGGAANYTPAGTNSVSDGAIAWPAGVPTIGTYTPAGTNGAASFTGDSFDNRSAFIRLIACRKT